MRNGKWMNQMIDFFSERIPLEKLSFRAMVQKKEVPVHKMSWAYYLGGLALFFFMIQIVTGLLLLFYYEPTVSDAYASIQFITHHVTWGGLIRNLHTWSSSLMILCVMIHVLTTFAMKAFEKPREITWLTGVALLFITFTFGFTGYLLPWNQIAVNATKVGLQSIEALGEYLPGAMSLWPTQIKEIIQGGPAVGQATLSRFYATHVVILPLLIFAVLGFHLLSVQLHGMSQGVDKPSKKKERFFPFFIVKDFSLWGIIFLAVFILALCLPFESFFPYPLFEPYDPLGSTPDGIKPEWYFLFLFYPLELLPFWMVLAGTLLATVVLTFTPWIFKGTSRKVLSVIAILAAIYLVVITIFGEQIHHMIKGGA